MLFRRWILDFAMSIKLKNFHKLFFFRSCYCVYCDIAPFMEPELSDIVGRHVDLKTAGDLSPYFRNDVLAKAKIIYG